VELEEAVEPLETQLAELRARVQDLEAASSLPAVRPTQDLGTNRSTTPVRESSSNAVIAIDTQIAQSSPNDSYAWIQARREVILQDQFVADRAHLRRLETIGLVGKLGLSVLAIASGAGLAAEGFGLPGFLCLGAGLYGLAPNFVSAVAKRVLGAEPKDHA
jgi:hypothetical protein